MDRRAFVGMVAGGFLVGANITRAQPIRKIATVGILHSSPAATLSSPGIIATRNGLRELGYVEGQNIRSHLISRLGSTLESSNPGSRQLVWTPRPTERIRFAVRKRR